MPTTDKPKPKRIKYTKFKSLYISEEQDAWIQKNGLNFSQWVRNKISIEMEPEHGVLRTIFKRN